MTSVDSRAVNIAKVLKENNLAILVTFAFILNILSLALAIRLDHERRRAYRKVCMDAKLLTCKQVCTILHRSSASVSRDMKEGRIPAIHLGRSVRFKSEDIERIRVNGFAPVPQSQEAR